MVTMNTKIYFERFSDGKLLLYKEAADKLIHLMMHVEYMAFGPISIPPTEHEKEILTLRQMLIASGVEIEELT